MFKPLVYQKHGVTKDDEGLGVFFRFGWAPNDRNQASHILAAAKDVFIMSS
jgi:hypothetical protein